MTRYTHILSLKDGTDIPCTITEQRFKEGVVMAHIVYPIAPEKPGETADKAEYWVYPNELVCIQ